MALEFKSKEELQLMPQTMEEHLDELNSQYSDGENLSVSSFDEDQVYNEDKRQLLPLIALCYFIGSEKGATLFFFLDVLCTLYEHYG